MAQEDRRRVLDMLAEGKISAEEAERLLEVLAQREGYASGSEGTFDDRIEQVVSSAARTAVSTARSVITAAASATSEQMDVDLRTRRLRRTARVEWTVSRWKVFLRWWWRTSTAG